MRLSQAAEPRSPRIGTRDMYETCALVDETSFCGFFRVQHHDDICAGQTMQSRWVLAIYL